MEKMNNNNTIVQIRDALSRVNQKVNLIGFVREFSFPRKSLGTDYVSTLKIVDESYRENELSVQIFTGKVEDLPLPRSHKDFIILYKVKITEFNGRIYAVFNKIFSSYALFDEKSCIDFNPYQASPGFHLLGPDMDFVRRMGHSCSKFPFSGGMDEYLLSLKDIKSDKPYFDLVCKVLHVEEVTSNVWMLFVWDGNDTPPLSLDTNLNDEEQNPLPLHIEQFLLPSDILCTFPRVGTVLRVMTDKAHEKFGLNFNGIGKWVRFRNMTCEVHFGSWKGLLTSSSRVRYLPENHDIVLECIRNFNQRGMGEEGRFPSWSSPPYLAVIDYENVPFATMMDLLTQPEVGGTVKCIVRVLAVCPPQPKEFCTPVGSDQYRMRLTLEDPTARLHATLCGDDWVKFFGDCFSVDVLTTKMNKLLGVPGKEGSGSLRSPPWIKCCINVNSVEYHICGTRLVDI
ncbi:protection of telomeres protein 1a-like isoform X1 [Corylus avellana]|uniref:protection of telomeres protein 1a-like isoform X1 n=1 Tax=Corylus avellana TaxID=13451 RepID=UPI00286A30CE|nr:protection of telomeres protein 1a-like isoform X1 [Corylus avellana]